MHTLLFDLKDAIQESGCPVCLLQQKFENQYLETLFYEYVNDRELREKLRSRRSFCQQHVRMIFEKRPSVLGISILFSDFLHHRFSSMTDNKNNRCPVCENWEGKETHIRQGLKKHWREMKSSWGKRAFLCEKHLRTIPWDESSRQEITSLSWRSLKNIARDLSSLIRKFDYQTPKESISREEGTSWQEVLEFFAGSRLRKKSTI